MVKRRLFFASFLFLTAQAAADGNRVGNGGNILECSNKNKAERYQLLDLFEAAFPLANFRNENEEEIVQRLFTELKRVAPSLSQQYQARFSSFLKETELKDEIEIISSNDSKQAMLPKGCILKQVAIRKNEVSSQEKRFLISKSLWKEMNSTNRAALYIHEIIYEHCFKLGEGDSQKARKLTAYFFAKDFNQKSSKDFWDYIKSLRLPIYQH